jgi:hypothetical protein
VANNDITDAKNKNVETSVQIAKTDAAINKTVDDTLTKTSETTAEVNKQKEAYMKLQTVVKNYNEEIQTGAKIIGQSLELMATVMENKATSAQNQIDALNIQYDEMNTKEADRQQKLLDYEDELKNANGERYNELLKLIDQEKNAKDKNYITETQQKQNLADLDHKKLVADHEAAQWRKAASIIDAVIQGALAVIKALPNVILSVAVGVLSGLEVATISAQKIPDVPPEEKFKEGGFSGIGGDDQPAGIVHKNEYITPAKVVRNPMAQAHIAALENIRLKAYQGGGFVAPANSSLPSYMEFDYDRLAAAMSKIPAPQVALVDILNGTRKIALTQNLAGINRQ